MGQPEKKTITWTTLSIGSVVFLAFALTGCMSVEEQRRANLYEDEGTCSDFGTRYGSQAYTQCMLQQQQRRDQAQLLAAEQARITSETTLNSLETMRRLREGKR
ncbi:hypothetical protein IB279_25700 [Ensifer sp. ENS06]|uniref:hypothetical protein n=1 Tax=Ensifer sp. ENS06 TaxID=2769276 RepID=UPI000DE42097|nr:hypothetical protein [Ensifer sp. ENS06]MBD9626347.1 hypothetical protein [Ensifer sp. ENS06]